MAHEAENRREKAPSKRLEELLETLCDQELSTAEAEELKGLLERTEENRRTYLKTVHLVAGMRNWTNSRGSGDINGLLALMNEPNREVAATNIAVRERRIPKRFSRAAAGLAASLFAAALFWWGIDPDSEVVANPDGATTSGSVLAGASGPVASLFVEDTDHIVARVVSISSDLRWASDAAPADFLMRLRPGDLLAIEQGTANIEFTGGAELILDSACQLQITSPTSARLLDGMLVGRADGDDSFTVVTPSATVVDVGTEFGVTVGVNGTDVSVFDGEVHVHGLHATEPASSFVRKLLEGMSVRVDRDGVHRNASPTAVARLYEGRQSLHQTTPTENETAVSLLDLLAGKRSNDQVVAGSIDPVTGFWGRYKGYSVDQDAYYRTVEVDGSPYRATRWTPLIDGVFVPEASGLSTQYNSKGATLDLPSSIGTSWGPIWARRRLEPEVYNNVFVAEDHDFWGRSAFECATTALATATDGILGLHANVGITFNLEAIRERTGWGSSEMRLVGSVTNLDNSQLMEHPVGPSLVDARIYVDGELLYSRLNFGRSDGDEAFELALPLSAQYLTLVTSDADGSLHHDHVVLIDPRIERVEEIRDSAPEDTMLRHSRD